VNIAEIKATSNFTLRYR